jgi:hypothetical protein
MITNTCPKLAMFAGCDEDARDDDDPTSKTSAAVRVPATKPKRCLVMLPFFE